MTFGATAQIQSFATKGRKNRIFTEEGNEESRIQQKGAKAKQNVERRGTSVVRAESCCCASEKGGILNPHRKHSITVLLVMRGQAVLACRDAISTYQ